MARNNVDTEWLEVFREIVRQPDVTPRFALAILQALDADLGSKTSKMSFDLLEYGDAVADLTSKGLPGRTMVVVNWEAKKLPSIDLYVKECKSMKCEGVLFLMPLATPTPSVSSLPPITRTDPPLKFAFMGYKEILPLLTRQSAIVTKYVPHLTSLAVKERLKEAQAENYDYWKLKQEKHLETLRIAYAQDNLCLFLGAGVSIQGGLPTWRQLIDNLMIRAVQRVFSKGMFLDADKIRSAAHALSAFRGDNPLISARYIRKALGDEFETNLKDALYRNWHPPKRDGMLDELSVLCKPYRASVGAGAHTGAQAVVTYNFDDLFDKALAERDVPYRAVSSDNDRRGGGALNVFHVHGLLRRDPAGKVSKSKALELVFSEDRYHHLYTQAYSWSNMQQLYWLQNSTCLLVGFSMTDPNLRRLLEISAGSGRPPRHVALLKRTLITEAMRGNKLTPRLSRDEMMQVLRAHHEIQELAFEELGVNIVWFERYSDIEGILKKIRPSASTRR